MYFTVARQWQQDLPGNSGVTFNTDDAYFDYGDERGLSFRPESRTERSPLLSCQTSFTDGSTAVEDGGGMGKAGVVFLLRNTRLSVTLLAIIIIGALVPGLETVGLSIFFMFTSYSRLIFSIRHFLYSLKTRFTGHQVAPAWFFWPLPFPPFQGV